MKISQLSHHITVANLLKFIVIGALFTSFLLIIDENGTGYKTFFNIGNLIFLVLMTSMFSLIAILIYSFISLKLRGKIATIITTVLSYTLTMLFWISIIS
ncbi:MAG TPA: hypothetical protein VGF79_00265 [Bacteroidia bacterium]